MIHGGIRFWPRRQSLDNVAKETTIEKLLSEEKLIEMYKKMMLIRHFEDRVHRLFLTGERPGTIHLYQGQKAVGVCTSFRKEDVITSTHRPHGHAIAKGVSVKSIMAELFGKATSGCKGKGGPMHMGDIEVGMVPAVAIVGGGIPVATGIALVFKMKRVDRVAVFLLWKWSLHSHK